MKSNNQSNFQNMRLSKRLLLSFGVILILTAVITIFALYFILRIGSFTQQLYAGPYNNTTVTEVIRADLNEAGIAIRNGFLEKDMGKYADTISNSGESTSKNLALLEERFKGDSQLLTDLTNALNTFTTERTKVVDSAIAGDYETAFQILTTSYSEAFTVAMEKANAVYSSADSGAASLDQRNSTVTLAAIIFLSSVLIITIIFAIVLSIITTKSVVRPMQELQEAAKQMAEGNLKAEIKYNSHDEMGSLANSMRTMITQLDSYITDISWGMKALAEGNLNIDPNIEFHGDFIMLRDNIMNTVIAFNNAISKIDESSTHVSTGAVHVAESGRILSENSTEQAAAIEELCTTIDVISGHVSESAANAQQASTTARAVGSDIEQSNRSMQQMVDAMNEISRSSNEISKIIRTIESIASQTNLLSLNAAIEAARAGDAGKGFAVVAEEVRNLAAESAEASKNSTALIESSLNAVEKGMAIVEQTASSLGTVVEKAKMVMDTVDQISAEAGLQAKSIDTLSSGISQISASMEENTAAIEESAAASDDLSSLAQMLNTLVAKFQLRK